MIARLIARLANCLRFACKFLRLLDTALWRAADRAVLQVLQHHELQQAAKVEETTSFCPRCGQHPEGDRRMDEAREAFFAEWHGGPLKRSELDFALVWAYFRRKI